MKNEQFMFPASYAQQRLWILDQMVPGNFFYNLSAPIRLSFPVNSLVLKRSLNEIVQRHETLRTIFAEVDGQPFQVVRGDLELDLPYHDISHLNNKERDEITTELINADAKTSFDLAKGPLLRTTLIKCGPSDFIFLLTMHHIISDGWSRFIFFRELTSLYDQFAQGKPSHLPELPIQYADFAIWQREYLSEAVVKDHLDFWKEKLRDMQMLNLPINKPRPILQSFQGSYELLEFSPELSEQVRNLAKKENNTLFMTLLAGFIGLLHRYTQQDDIVLGVPVANRNQTEIEHLIGFFVNSILIRTIIKKDASFIELLQAVKSESLEAYKHEDLPFEMLVEALHPERDLSRNPLFQVSFQFLQFPTFPGQSPGTGSPFVGIDKGTSIFDLRVSFAEYNNIIGGEIEYSTDLFERESIQRMCDHFIRFMTSATAHSSMPIAEIDFLQQEENNLLISEWNNTKRNFKGSNLLHQLFEEQVKLTPHREAVIFRNTKLQFEELNGMANQLAHYILELGLKPGDYIGVYLERSEKMIISFLAILKCGCAYIPLDPSYPKDRIQMILEDAHMAGLITQHALSSNITHSNIQAIYIDEQWDMILSGNKNNLSLDIHNSSIAYVIYTSGSTGIPKGVMIPHAAICNHMLWMNELFPMEDQEIVMQRTPYSFDASVWEFYAPLISGGCLYIAEEEGNRDPGYLVEKIKKHSINVLQVVPSMLKLLLEHPDFDECISLKRVYCGGEPLPATSIQAFYRLLDAQLYNLYGPTEATIDVSCWLCKINNESDHVLIGKPISNTSFFVLDDHMNPVPIGVPGELYIGGKGLARGYLNNPSMTALKFIPDPFNESPGERLYRTGDLVRYSADGNLEYIERTDHQIKLRGFRIEPGEIEFTIKSIPGIRDATVLVHKMENGEQQLVAFVVPQIKINASEAVNNFIASIRDFLQSKLPVFMVPAVIQIIETIPLKPNGKIDRQLLPVPTSHGNEMNTNYVAPSNQRESALADIWGKLLHIEKVGIHDHFFQQLGGNSLLATQMISRVRDRFKVKMPLQSIFKAPTIHGFSKLLQERLNIEEVTA